MCQPFHFVEPRAAALPTARDTAHRFLLRFADATTHLEYILAIPALLTMAGDPEAGASFYSLQNVQDTSPVFFHPDDGDYLSTDDLPSAIALSAITPFWSAAALQPVELTYEMLAGRAPWAASEAPSTPEDALSGRLARVSFRYRDSVRQSTRGPQILEHMEAQSQLDTGSKRQLASGKRTTSPYPARCLDLIYTYPLIS